MPITQERMLALVRLASRFEEVYMRMQNDMAALVNRKTDISPGEIYNIFWANKGAFQDLEMLRADLHIEREHFRRNAGRNNYNRRLAQKKREAAGIEPPITARKSFDNVYDKYGPQGSITNKELPLENRMPELPPEINNWNADLEAKYGKGYAPGTFDKANTKTEYAKRPEPPKSANRPLKDEEGNLIHYDDATPAELAAIEAELERQEQEGEGQGLGLEQG